MINEVSSDGALLTATRYGPVSVQPSLSCACPSELDPSWRRLRRAAHKGFSAQAVQAYRQTQEQAALLLLANFIDKPADWYDHLIV